MITLVVDGRTLEAEPGKSLLQVCLEGDVYIPNLCFLEGCTNPPASCRLCFVEIAGQKKPQNACRVEPVEGMVVRTDTEPVRRLQRTALRLLLSVHEANCKRCPSNRRCPLQRMARMLGVRLRPRRFEHLDRQVGPQEGHPLLQFIPGRCVLCGKCIEICRERRGTPLLTFANRGFDTAMTSYGQGEAAEDCSDCRACVKICPVSAILLREDSPGLSASQEGSP